MITNVYRTLSQSFRANGIAQIVWLKFLSSVKDAIPGMIQTTDAAAMPDVNIVTIVILNDMFVVMAVLVRYISMRLTVVRRMVKITVQDVIRV